MIIKLCDKYHLPWIVENPHATKLWLLPEFQQLLQASHTEVRVVDFCAYSRPRRKRTQLLFGNVFSQDLDRLSHRPIDAAQVTLEGAVFVNASIFSVQLTGSGPGNVAWINIATPRPLQGPCACSVLCLHDSWLTSSIHLDDMGMIWDSCAVASLCFLWASPLRTKGHRSAEIMRKVSRQNAA